ncbi:hypothetical protein TTHERM_00088130 (macronuclear) [Tetrahymena thermophila SB210]|uniref:STOP protein n=1 Tax=Tetrahymena thermophila (strain SB210) TaxID=312017 RepID=Q236I3_TETTS|nr:hypothetical protein TTHERM_00088130 [Tetrahymena thermophila SB210]EAR92517.1 hypothetical protein TTHERM_00088130 [Tetrahymena thermophila SB210]|eukprot:XP_001012762.1 hypothetical protein TTHERM_00088130 [Tetrahymena thermophila SB210]
MSSTFDKYNLLNKEALEKKEILENHWLDLEEKNQKYFNHVKGDCLCNICSCGKCKCRSQKLQIQIQAAPQSIYMRSYSPPNKNYNAGNGSIKEQVDQTKSVLNLRFTNEKIGSSSRSLESRSNQNGDLNSNTDSLTSRDIANYYPRMLKYGNEKPFYDPSPKQKNQQFTDEEINQLCSKTNFQRDLDNQIRVTQARNQNNYKTSSLKVQLSPSEVDSTYRQNYAQKNVKLDEPIIQLQELPPNVRSIPFNINSFSRVQSHKMFEELGHLKDNVLYDQNKCNFEQKVNNENDKSALNLGQKDLVKFLNRHRSFSPNQRSQIQNNDYDKEKVSFKLKQVLERKNDLTQNDFINYAQKAEKLQKTVFSCYDKFVEEDTAYKKNHCNQEYQSKIIKISKDQEYNYNQVDNLINQNVQKINKVGYFLQIPSYEGQFNSQNQTSYQKDQKYIELCPSRKAKLCQSPDQPIQNCKEDDLELLPRKYYNHRYYRPIKQVSNQSKQGSKIVKVKIDPQKADIPAFINQLQQQKIQEKIKNK